MIQKVLNRHRGEIPRSGSFATCRGNGIKTLAVYSEADVKTTNSNAGCRVESLLWPGKTGGFFVLRLKSPSRGTAAVRAWTLYGIQGQKSVTTTQSFRDVDFAGYLKIPVVRFG